MAKKMYFQSLLHESENYFVEREVEFNYFPGFSLVQKRKCIESLHIAIRLYNNELKILEVSSKSDSEVGRELSAFNLELDYFGKKYPIECVFQSSKKFSRSGPYIDLLDFEPIDAKRDERLKNSGEIIGFEWNNIMFPNEPKSYFYDWIYISALKSNKSLSDIVINYNTFTDIEFNHKKSYNCQARSVALYVSLVKRNKVDQFLDDYEFAKQVYNQKGNLQMQFGLAIE